MALFFNFGGGLAISIDAIEELAQSLNFGDDKLSEGVKLVVEAEVLGHEVENHCRLLRRPAELAHQRAENRLDVSGTSGVEPVMERTCLSEIERIGRAEGCRWERAGSAGGYTSADLR